MSNGNGGGIPWPVWALVTLGAALITAYAALAGGGGGDGNGGNPPPPPIDFSDRVGVYTYDAAKMQNFLSYASASC